MTRREPQRGNAMLVTMIIIAALFSGGAVLVSMQMASNKATDLERTGLASLYCAEAGLVASHATVAANYTSWNGSLCTTPSTPNACTQPTWLGTATFSHDLDGDGVDDFIVYIKDNDDETGTNDISTDIDKQIFIVSRCTKYNDIQREVEELIKYTPTMTCYNMQDGGCNGRGNTNQ